MKDFVSSTGIGKPAEMSCGFITQNMLFSGGLSCDEMTLNCFLLLHDTCMKKKAIFFFLF